MDNIDLVNFVSYTLSTFTVLLCVFLKVPQIIQIRQRKAAEGLYVQALLMEIMGFTIVSLYNYMNSYSLMTYLEYPIILCQVFIMLYHVLLYEKMLSSPLVPIAFLAYIAAVVGILTQLIPLTYLSYLVPLCMPLSGFAKVMYIYGMYNVHHAETTSLSTWAISIFTNFSRLYTIYVDSADPKLLYNITVSSLLSLAVFLTAIYYKFLATQCKHQVEYRDPVFYEGKLESANNERKKMNRVYEHDHYD